MRRFTSLLTALLFPVAQPLLLGTAVTTGSLLVYPIPAQAQSAEAVAKVAQAITVRIEGATQGSGVLVKRDGNRYTVLTAWHVVSAQRPGEELDIYTPDGQRHPVEQGSIRRLGEVDMAVLSFAGSNTYTLSSIGDVKSVLPGSPIFVAGFPLPTQAVNERILRFLRGDVVANTSVLISGGYQLLYSNPTLPGMSGGAVLNARGQLVGIHGQGETDIKMSESKGVAVKTGNNQAVPISYYRQASSLAPRLEVPTLMPMQSGDSISAHPPAGLQVKTTATGVIAPVGFRNVQDALVSAASLLALNDYDSSITQTSEILAYRHSWFAYYLRSAARFAKGMTNEALSDINESLALRSDYASSYYLRSRISELIGREQYSCKDLLLAKAYGSQPAGMRLLEKCSSAQYPASFLSANANPSFFSKARSGYVNIGTVSSWDNTVTPVLVKIISVSDPLIVLEERSRMNSVWNALQTGKIEINCAAFWLEPSASLYQFTPGSSNVIPYLYKYFCRQPG
jgi:hypothetical protein